MKKALNIFRAMVIALAVMLIATPVSLYVILSTSWAQDSIRRVANNELSALLATEVSIGRVEIHPFNRISLHNVIALDDNGSPALEIEEISAAFELFHLLRTSRLVIDFALLYRPEIKLCKETKDSPINISNILSALQSDRTDKHQSRYDLKVNTVVIRKGSLRFDINDTPTRDSIFDPAHIEISDVFLNAYIPKISNSEYRVEIDRFAFKETSGFELTDLTAAAAIGANGSKLERLKIKLPNSALDFKPVSIHNKTIESLIATFRKEGIDAGILPGSTIYLPDLRAFAHSLDEYDYNIGIIADCKVSANDISASNIILSLDDNSLYAHIKCEATDLSKGVNSVLSTSSVKVSASSEGIKSVLQHLKRSAITDKIIKNLRGQNLFSANITATGALNNLRLRADVSFAENSLSLNGSINTRDSFKTINYHAKGIADFTNLGLLLPPSAPSALQAGINAKGRIARGKPSIDLNVDSASINYLGKRFKGISMQAAYNNNDYEASLTVDNKLIELEADCNGHIEGPSKAVDASLRIVHADVLALTQNENYAGYYMSGTADTQLEFTDIDDINGTLSISDLNICDSIASTPDFRLSALTVNARPSGDSPGIEISSDYINGYINGAYKVSAVYPTLRDMVCTILPSLDAASDTDYFAATSGGDNNFTFSFQISRCPDVCRFLHLPVSIIHTASISGHVSDVFHTASANVVAGYLLQGDRIIESTELNTSIDADDDRMNLYATTKIPTQKGLLTVTADLTGASDRVGSDINWSIERSIPIDGSFDFSTLLRRNVNNNLEAEITFNPGTITFGTDIWNIRPSSVDIADKRISVDYFSLVSDDKSITVNGTVSANDDDNLRIFLNKFTLLDIFETLEIDNVLIGGTATGVFSGRKLLSSEPEITCKRLHVDDISYNYCVLGDADISAYWNNEHKSFSLDADITGSTGLHSKIFGEIFPTHEALDLTFDVSHAPVGFMKPFMAAFASDLEGHVTGKARLFGTFKELDMEGNVFAENFRIKIGFTNTWYTANDNIYLRPGEIEIPGIEIRDIYGNTAKLSGYLKHRYFKDPSFRFDVSDARNLLSYNVDETQNSDWYGTIYGNGGVTVSGEPGVVDINVMMATAPHSTFTFVLSGRLDAEEYSFIKFTDIRAEARRDSIISHSNIPEFVRNYQAKRDNQTNDDPSAFNLNLQVDINPNAQMTLVMDPLSGDEIKATGSGTLGLNYGSLNNDLKMYGTYKIDRGSYSFSLQDIIVKEFIISEGSTIDFRGDPYSAQLGISAIYPVNANLSDLDESFTQDKDLNRTNVPVHALLLVNGDMRQPNISFDLAFPTLTQDTYRKVKSIISTDEMMNRQIIYLLALNRFYTPEYMASTTKGNELVSVASSTLSSQLGNMLGKLSDAWSIAPNLRSDHGDFSDFEVDVALSSRLLNNRLLFNGNFGYRDKTLNTNQFVGDFDIEYLLNPSGNWRLKAYNRYNDQNYYVRTAQTTQGVGLLFKRDFNDFFSFLRRKKKVEAIDQTGDSTTIEMAPVPEEKK